MTPDEALKWIGDVFEVGSEQLSTATARAEIPAWDSLGVLTLMSRLDQDFGILLTDEEVRGLRGVSCILEVLRRNQKLAA
jgi:acyl carrier protein